MFSDEIGYNRRVKVVDLLYLATVIYAFSQFYEIEWWISYPIFFVICYSIILDWRSAVAMANTGQFKYMIFDLFTVFNYYGIINNLLKMNNYNSVNFTLFLIHYSMVFFIYIAWNIAILISNKEQTTKRTKSFFSWFNVIGLIDFALCVVCIFRSKFGFLSIDIILVILILIVIIHLLELLNRFSLSNHFSSMN